MAFPSGKANLTPSSLPLLGKVRRVIADLGTSSVIVEGHTDSIGSEQQNQKLSEVRAEAIGTYLRVNGDASNDIKVVGFGYSKPIASNKTSVGRAQNRRVDINIEPTPKVRF